MEIEIAAASSSQSELLLFFKDYWMELKRYDPIIGLLTAWGVFEAPPKFQHKKMFRMILLVTQVFLAIGLTVQLSCQRDPMEEGPSVIITVLLITIPIEILNLIWFRAVKDSSEEVKLGNETKKDCCHSCISRILQFVAKLVGTILGFVVFAEGTIFFVLAFAGIHPGCSESQKYALVWHVILFQFLLVPVLMSLPYWRDQGSILSVLGELGPVIGLLMHVRKYGFHPPPPVPLISEIKENSDVENPVRS